MDFLSHLKLTVVKIKKYNLKFKVVSPVKDNFGITIHFNNIYTYANEVVNCFFQILITLCVNP